MTQWRMMRKSLRTTQALSRVSRLSVAAMAVGGALAASQAHAASATWTGGNSATDVNWSDGANWSTSSSPGSTSSLTSMDVATFSGTPTATTINLDQSYNLGSIVFGNAVTSSAFTINASGGSSLLLSGVSSAPTSTSSGNAIVNNAGTPGVTQYMTINAPIILENTSGSSTGNGLYYVAANGGSQSGASSFISITGSVTGSASTGNVSTLTIYGGNNTRNISNVNEISGVISDGANGGQLALAFQQGNQFGTNGSTNWILGAQNTYSGGTLINTNGYNNGLFPVYNTSFGTGTITWGSGNNFIRFFSANLNIANPETTNSGQTGYLDTSLYSATVSGSLSGNSYQKQGNNSLTLTGSNSYTGTTAVSGGTLIVGNAYALGNNAAVNMSSSGAVLNLNGYNSNVGAVTSVAGTTIVNNGSTPGTLTINETTGTTAAGVFQDGSGTLAINLTGSSNLVFSGSNNNFSGGLTVSGTGYAQTAGSGNTSQYFGLGTITLSSSANAVTTRTIYNPSNSNNWNNNIVVTGGTINRIENSANGNDIYTGTLTGNGTLVLSTGFTPTIQFAGDMTSFGGTLELAGNGGTSSVLQNYDLKNSTSPVGVPLGTIILTPALLSSNVGNVTNLRYNPTTAASAVVPIGQLSTGTFGGSQGANNAMLDNLAAGTTATFQVGGLNTNSTFAGVITNGTGTGIVAINKVGNGSWTVGTTLNANTTITTTSGSTSATAGANNNGLQVGELISGTGIAPGTTLTAVSGTSLTLSTAATATVSAGAFAVQNDYTGTTNISGGTLVLNGVHGNGTTGNYLVGSGTTFAITGNAAITGSASVAVSSGGTLFSNGSAGTTASIAGPVTLAGGATLNMIDGSIKTLALTGGLTVGDSATGNPSALQFGVGGTAADLLALGSGVFTENTGGASINVSNGGISSGTTYTLATFASGTGSFTTGTGVSVGGLTLVDPSLGSGITGTLNVTATAIQLLTTGGGAVPVAAYWSGGAGSVWTSNNNFTTTFDGSTAIAAAPGSTTSVYFANDGAANLTNTLGGSFDIASLTFLGNTTGAVTIGGMGNTLTLEAGGLTVNASAGAVTLNMSTVSLDASQTWTNNSSNPLTVNSAISGGAAAALTLKGGSFVLGSANTYAGGTTIVSGNVQLGNSTALGTGGLALNGGTLDLNGNSVGVTVFSGNNASAGIINNGSVAATLSAGGSSNTTYAGTLSDGNSQLAFTKTGTGMMLLNNNNNYSGTTTINQGILQAGSGSSLGSGSLVINSGSTLDLNGQTLGNAVTFVSGTGANSLGAIINNSATQASLSNTISGGNGNSFTVGGSGPIDLPTVTETGSFTMTDINTSTVLLDGTNDNSFLGLTMNSAGGTVVLNKSIFFGGGHAANNVTVINGTVQYGTNQDDETSFPTGQINNILTLNGGVVDLNGNSGIDTTLQILTSSNPSTGVITNTSSTPATLTISPNNTGTNTLYATIKDTSATNSSTGSVSVVYNPISSNGKNAVQVLAGTDSYTGGTNVAGGTLTFAAPRAYPNFTSLIIGSGALVNAANHGTAAKNMLFTSSLSIAGTTGNWTGKLDLANNDMVVQNGSLADITNQVAEGYNAGKWNGSGGIASTAAAADTTHLTALGVILNSANGLPGGSVLYPSFDGATAAASTDVLVKYTYYGDTDLSGTVDGTDYGRIDAAYLNNTTGGTPMTGWYNGDFNYDGVIDGSDYTLMDNAFNMQSSNIAAQIAAPTSEIAGAATGTSSVPEPTTLGLLGIGAVGLLGRRRRHN